MSISLNISYSASNPDDPLRQFDFYSPQHPINPNPPLLCFVHGGAWRAEDKAMHNNLANRLAAATGCPVAVPNYRLTPSSNQDPALRHPIHTQDLLSFLLFLTKLPSSDPQEQQQQQQQQLSAYDRNTIILIGHSCSAHMISCLLLKDGVFDAQFRDDKACKAVLHSVKGVVCSEGIYDLDTLTARFPDYTEWFIQPAFGPPSISSEPSASGYKQFSALHFPLRDQTDDVHWLLLHSHKDTLVNVEQTTEMHQHLLAVTPHPDRIHLNTQDLTQDHDDVLATDIYIDIIHKFISKLT